LKNKYLISEIIALLDFFMCLFFSQSLIILFHVLKAH
jgi:hypothetical protein